MMEELWFCKMVPEHYKSPHFAFDICHVCISSISNMHNNHAGDGNRQTSLAKDAARNSSCSTKPRVITVALFLGTRRQE